MVRNRRVSVCIDIDSGGDMKTGAQWWEVLHLDVSWSRDALRMAAKSSASYVVPEIATHPPAIILAMSTPSRFFSDSVSTMLMGMPMTTWPES